METAPLKSFATWARTALIREVTARIALVIAPASLERVEKPKSVEDLEKAVEVAGGGDKGRAAVADKVAYTWFNRIIALRFMDANGYTGVGVVSPQVGVEAGQPEVLAEAKRGNIDAAVVGPKIRDTVTALLNGSRRSDDAQGEAYALLLADYCRYWNRAMPFMFEREGDFTELLVPANLLADDSVPSRAVRVLTKDVCQDVEVIGWLYQFYISERKDEVFAGFKKNKKAGADEIPAATQLFTPHWIVRYLVENSLGRLWMLNRPSSHLVAQMSYYIAPIDEELSFLNISCPEELKVIDPACGSGHMLTYAFDLLYLIYEEEGYSPAEIPGLILVHNLYGTEIDPRAGALAAFALTMKARAKQRTFLNKQVEVNIGVIEPISFGAEELNFLATPGGGRREESAFWNQFAEADTLGSLINADADLTARLIPHVESLDDHGDIYRVDTIARARRVLLQARFLAAKYAVVVANPPYMGNGNMDPKLKAAAKRLYPRSKADLFAMFIERALSLTVERGYAALITMETWMFLGGYAVLRKSLLESRTIASMVHLPYLGKGGTSMGINFGTCATVFLNSRSDELRGNYQSIRYFETDSAGVPIEFPTSNEFKRVVSAQRFEGIAGSPIAYWLSDEMLDNFKNRVPLGAIAEARKGMITARNDEFIRTWSEVSARNCGLDRFESRVDAQRSQLRWFAFIKGGAARRWWGNMSHVVDWLDDGNRLQNERHPTEDRVWATNFNLDYIFKPNVNWGEFSSGEFTARLSLGGQLFNGTGSACFPSSDHLLAVLAFLNSKTAAAMLRVLNPTMHFLSGDIAQLPFSASTRGLREAADLADQAVRLARQDWDEREVSWDFVGSPLVAIHKYGRPLEDTAGQFVAKQIEDRQDLRRIEERNNELWITEYGLHNEMTSEVDPASIVIGETDPRMAIRDLVSYAVGCMFGRYGLDIGGLVLADQGATLRDYLAKVPAPSFKPDADNVIPVVDGDWFEDDIVGRFRAFLRTAFGEEHFERNLRFVTESLGVRDIRDYFVKSFYSDHVQRYKKRPIYWLFSSPAGSFNALIYMHRYTPSTVSTVLNEYLREFQVKLSSSLHQQELLAASGESPRQQAAAQKEADRLRKVLVELEEYEHDVLYPLASRQLAIDLDDGVKANYPKFGAALKKIPGLEASDE
ncbi:Eco57I restriction-modification methylase [Jatrophihabitans sp. GAS493]|uniref:BREX-1 system adenine-specific DNA-methyltransferase PglX n=1 Tax=Jatrophihabitans sp. GAS493 TaxID=1907575 RepID=UPI000BB6A3CF|nr:BREX-1 system adenine-specific DNA-methyltransferase PglX [Jatrophihabitans sp. GAS493]SOD73484.1 Eco57I restriction-modification methylase [Jatrophihabitans sp. GAS493]